MKPLISRFLNILQATVLSLVASMLFSCAREVEVDIPQPSGVMTTFGISVAAKVKPVTRAITEGTTDDNDVQEITIMLFKPETGRYETSVRTTAIAPVAGTGKENLRTFRANILPGNYKALFLANAKTIIDEKYDIVSGTVKGGGNMNGLSMDDIESDLKRTFSGKYNAKPNGEVAGYAPFVMSSDRINLTVPSTVDYSANPIPLSRDVAKINVKFQDQAVSDRFKINEIRLCNYNTLSYAVPASGWWSNTSPLFAATGVTRPVGSIVTGYTGIPYSYKDSNGDGIEDEDSDIKNNGCIDEIFTAERPVGSDNLCLLINGDVTISGVEHTDRWYKIEFARKEKDGDKPKHVNILRNYSYTVTISGISTPGYGSEDEAYNLPAGNLVTDLTAVEDDGVNSFIYSGQYYLGVTKNIYDFSSISELEQGLKIHTDYPGGWEITPKLQDWPDWLNNGVSSWTAMSGIEKETVAGDFWPDVNLTDVDRQFTFTVKAGPLSQSIIVKQQKNGYIFAAPGIPGIPLSQYRQLMIDRAHSGEMAKLDPSVALTLKGSSTYNNTRVEPTAAEFGGLYGEEVFTVYFLWGSTVAMVRHDDDDWTGDGREVVWVNPEFAGSTVGEMNSDAAFGRATAKSFRTDYDITDNPAKGHGDICRILNNDYRIPAGNPWRLADGSNPWHYDYTGDFRPNYWQNSDIPAYFLDKRQNPNEYIYIGYSLSRIYALNNNSMFLPAASAKSNTNISATGIDAIYMTATASDEINQFILRFGNDIYNPTNLQTVTNKTIHQAFPIRCVRSSGSTQPPAVDPTLAVTPDPVYVGYDSGSKAQIVVTTNQSSWAVSAKPAWIDVDTNGTITVNQTNNNNTERSGQLTITAGSATPVTVTVIQAPQPQLPYGNVVAPPGVLGYTAGSRKLTLKGSREYAGTVLETNSEFGKVSNETVYVAYFQYGSLIAMSSEANDGTFDDEDIVWAPIGYRNASTQADALAQAKAAIGGWSTVPSSTTNWNGAVASGLGDPCKYAEAGGSGWQVPSKSQLSGFNENTTKWYGIGQFTSHIPYSAGRVMGTSAPHDWSMFLAATGSRNSNGGAVNNPQTGGLAFGSYWFNSATSAGGDAMIFYNGSLTQGSHKPTTGNAIRCMRGASAPPAPTVPVLEHAGNTLPNIIPQPGSTYTVKAKTNLPTWGLKVYAGTNNTTGTLLTEIKNISGSASDATTAVYSTQIEVEANNSESPRKLSFYIYSDHYTQTPQEIYIGTWTQAAILTLPSTGVLCPPGVLGVSTSGELTLRGSKEYGTTIVEDYSQFGPVHEESVYVVYFKWGSLAAVNSPMNGASPNGDTFDFSDFSWINPGYTHNGKKGGSALKDKVGTSTGAAAWQTKLPEAPSYKTNWTPVDLPAGLGDPCAYATTGSGGTGWRMPSGTVGWNNAGNLDNYLFPTSVTLKDGKTVVKGRSEYNPNGAQTAANKAGWRMFLPLVGSRNLNGTVIDRGMSGMYWSDYMTNYLTFTSDYIGTASNPTNMGFAVRCVK